MNKGIHDYIHSLKKENQELKRQLNYLRSGEYLNQLKFERNMLEDIVNNLEVSKEDKEFIDMTKRNTDLLEENKQLKEKLKKKEDIINKARKYVDENVYVEGNGCGDYWWEIADKDKLLDILKEVE